jgi:hypothetical protein
MLDLCAMRRVVCVASLAMLAGCSDAPGTGEEELDRTSSPLTAVCEANVKGVGMVSVEDKYLANVVHCENGGAPFEALKAQAIVARSYLYYKMETSGAIADGTSDQVYSCGSGPTAEQIKAVKDTAGQVLRYKGITVCAFFVAGGAASPPACKGSTAAATEKYVTYNEGKTGDAVTQTTLGFVSPTNYRNRGCLSQLGSRCLDNAGKTAEEIIKFYYGADIIIETAVGPCVPTTTPDAAPPPDTTPPPKDTSVVDTATGDTMTTVEDTATPQEDSSTPIKDSGAFAPASADVSADLEGSCACSTPKRTSTGGAAFALLAIALATRRKR